MDQFFEYFGEVVLQRTRTFFIKTNVQLVYMYYKNCNYYF